MRQSLPSLVLFTLIAVSFFVSACSSAPPPAPPATETANGTAVTVVGWSLRDQQPVAVEGVLRQGGRDVARFDTRARPDGTTIPVSAGPYEVQITHRLKSERFVAASGLERVDARNGEVVRCEVVVDDREGGDAAAADNSR